MNINTLEIRNNAQILSIVSYDSIGLVYSSQNMLEFALEFDGLLLEDKSRSTLNALGAKRHEKPCLYDYHPAISSDTIHHPSWIV